MAGGILATHPIFTHYLQPAHLPVGLKVSLEIQENMSNFIMQCSDVNSDGRLICCSVMNKWEMGVGNLATHPIFTHHLQPIRLPVGLKVNLEMQKDVFNLTMQCSDVNSNGRLTCCAIISR